MKKFLFFVDFVLCGGLAALIGAKRAHDLAFSPGFFPVVLIALIVAIFVVTFILLPKKQHR